MRAAREAIDESWAEPEKIRHCKRLSSVEVRCRGLLFYTAEVKNELGEWEDFGMVEYWAIAYATPGNVKWYG